MDDKFSIFFSPLLLLYLSILFVKTIKSKQKANINFELNESINGEKNVVKLFEQTYIE